MKILVTGGEGLLGAAVAADSGSRGHHVVALGRDALDVTDAAAVRDVIATARPEAVVHSAAYTAVDRAESEPELARLVNRDGTRNVAAAAAEVGAKLVYVSTDYVFDGRKRTPYLPTDEPAPLSVYAQTKLEGEEVAEGAVGALIVRSSWLYGPGKGFVAGVLRRARTGERLRIVDDQRGGPTWVAHAATSLLDLLEDDARGVWHVADRGACTWRDLACEALELEGLTVEVQGVSSEEYGAPARRPAYSVLNVEATEKRLGRRLPDWHEGLSRFLAHRRGHGRNAGRAPTHAGEG